jgi:uncharacterized protein (DUF3084 family)
MTTGLVLIAAILVLGGVIATVGDRLGMRVGKARLSLFRLRPRQTATLITILTGIVISAVTFGILFAISDQLRTGVFELGEIQEDLANARTDLQSAQKEQEDVQQERDRALRQRQAARRQLRDINDTLQGAIAQNRAREEQLQATNQRLENTQGELRQIETNFRQAQSRLGDVTQQASQLRSEIAQLQRDRENQIAEREQEIAARDREIARREVQLRDLEAQQRSLEQAVAELEEEFQGLRQGNVALFRNRSLASNLVRVADPDLAPQLVLELFQEANQIALNQIVPGATTVNQQVLNVSNAQLEQLARQLVDGQEYVVQILSGGNYVVGEPCVLAGERCIDVFVAVTPNEVLVPPSTILANVTINPSRFNFAGLTEQYYLLVRTAQFRLRQAGVVTETQLQVADGRAETVGDFLQTLQAYDRPVEVQLRSTHPIFAASRTPIVLQLVAIQDGQELFQT